MCHRAKILDLDDLALRVETLRQEGRVVVLSHGVFDLLHLGHLRHLEEAKRQGDVLVVTLTQDVHVNKGPHRPAFPQAMRAEALAALACVDYVAVNRWPTAVETIQLLRPSVYAKGPDYKRNEDDVTGGIQAEGQAIQGVGGRIHYTEDISFSSSHLLNTFFSPYPLETEQYLESFRRMHSVDEVLGWLERASRLRPLVTGEAILDEYVACDSLGKSTKDPVLAVRQKEVEAYAGGTLAVANHLAGFCEEVQLVTQLGDWDRREAFIRGCLHPHVEPLFLTREGAPTLHKRRVVDQYTGTKLLEIYLMDDRACRPAESEALVAALEARFPHADCTIVADYGHGMVSDEALESLCAKAPFLAVNAQSNAGNRGFNPVSRYRRADYVCIATHEVEMELRRRGGIDHDQVRDLARRIDCPRFTVTRGKYGTLHLDREAGFLEAPSLATRIVDRVGAGDAVLAVTSLLLKAGAPWDIVAFVANATGAQAVADVGNRTTVSRVALAKFLTSLMK